MVPGRIRECESVALCLPVAARPAKLFRAMAPSINVRLNGVYERGQFVSTSVSFSKGFTSEATLLGCDCAVASNAAWLPKLWQRSWETLDRELEPPLKWPPRW